MYKKLVFLCVMLIFTAASLSAFYVMDGPSHCKTSEICLQDKEITTDEPLPGEPGVYDHILWDTSFTGPYGETIPVSVFYPQDDSDAPFPALSLGHGFTMDRGFFTSWGEYFASWGYVIAVPSLQYAGLFNSDHERCAYELLATLEFLKDMGDDPSSPIMGLVDENRMGLTGFSLGAKATVLAAQYDVADQTGLVKAIAPMAVSIGRDPDPLPDLPLIDIPVQLQAGEFDEIAPPDDNSLLIYEGISDSPKQYLMISGANHNQYADRNPISGGFGDGTATISRAEQHRIARKYSTSFFNYYLKGQSEYYTYLYGEESNSDVVDGTLNFNLFHNLTYYRTSMSLYADIDSGGWNFVSLELIPVNDSIEHILGEISHSFQRVMYYDAVSGAWRSYLPGRNESFNELRTWDHRMGIWISMVSNTTLTVEGTLPSSTEITLHPGWNMVGLPSSTSGNHGLPAEVTVVGYFDGAQPYNLAYDHEPATFVFNPGKGYWIYNPTGGTLVWTVDY